MLFKLIMVLVVGLIARSFSEDAPVMSSSDAAVTEVTAGSDDQQDSTAVSEKADSTAVSEEADSTAASEKADSSAVSEEAESSTLVDNVNEKDSATPESSDKSEDKAEKASESNDQKREVDEHQEKDDNHAETPKCEGETEQTEDSAVELNRTCIISNATHWSWLVKIVDKESGKQVCTGTLITDEDVLVPASCFMENTTQDVPESFYSLPAEILAIAGGGMDTDCMQIRNVSSIYPHKGYFENSEEHDYAFLKISPEFDVDDDDIPDIRYHLNVINSEGGLVNIHNNGPFCESPYFVDDGMNAKVSDEIHLLGMRIEDCMMIWNCSADFDTCLSYLHPASHACLKPLTPRKCGPRDKGAPLVCDEVLLGYLHQCDGELPMIFRGLNKAIKFLELEEDHVQRPGYMGRHY